MYAYILVCFSIAVRKHHEQKLFGRERVHFILWVRDHHEGKRRPELEAETTIEYCLLALLLCFHEAAFLTQPGPICLGMVPPTVGWVRTTSIKPHRRAHAWCFQWTTVPLPRWVRLTRLAIKACKHFNCFLLIMIFVCAWCVGVHVPQYGRGGQRTTL